MFTNVLITLSLLSVVSVHAWPGWHVPEQVHIAAGESPDQMIIVWTTMNDTTETTVVYGKGTAMDLKQNGTSTKVIDDGSEKRFWFVHHVVLKGLSGDEDYSYKVGCPLKYSNTFKFHTFPIDNNWQPSLIIYGDLGVKNAQSMDSLLKDAGTGKYDAIIHAGDFAYNLNSDNSRIGDTFMKMIEPLAANIPYMTCPGNHEAFAGMFKPYNDRFYMPGDDDKNMYFSFNVGSVHFVSINTEAWFYSNDIAKSVADQLKWLENDLSEAAKSDVRDKRPWIVVFGHRPMYCSNKNHDDCTLEKGKVRTGDPSKNISGVEELLQKYGVDVLIWAHEHSYERFWPVYNGKVYNGSSEAPYTNPGAPVNIVTGNAGCKEIHDLYPDDFKNQLSAFHSDDYGYMRMKVYNSSHMYMEEVSIDKNDVLDKIWLVKDKHGPYNNL